MTAERGSATVEFAMVLPAVVLLLATIFGAVSIGLAQVQTQEAANAAVRAAMLGEDPAAAARAVGGQEVETTSVRDGRWVVITVTCAGPLGLTLSAHATARVP